MPATKSKWIPIIFLILVSGCSVPVEYRLSGEWRLDSAYYFYNNFEYSRQGWHQEEIYEFTSEGVVFTKAVNSSVFNQYVVKGKVLCCLDEEGTPFNTYEILELTKNHMALKTEKLSLFKGPNQERYEIRYYSKLSSAEP